LNRLRERGFPSRSVSVAGVVFQACLIDRYSISPLLESTGYKRLASDIAHACALQNVPSSRRNTWVSMPAAWIASAVTVTSFDRTHRTGESHQRERVSKAMMTTAPAIAEPLS
jgi:hypothetical protein